MKRIIVLFTVSICLLIFSPNTFADEFSDEYKNRGTNRYFRVYAEVEPVKAKKKLIN